MITKRGVRGVISVLVILGAVYVSAGYLFETNLNDITTIVAVPALLASAATPAATVAQHTAIAVDTTTSATIAATTDPTTTPTPTTTVAPAAAANETATANSTAIETPTTTNATANATATSTATVNATATTNETVTAIPTIVNATVNATATPTPTLTAAPSIIGFSPNSPVSDTEGTPRIFEVATNQNVNVTWYINGKEVQSNESVITAAYTNTSAASGTWTVKATATNDNGTASQEWLWEVRDVVPPGNVTNLTEVSNGPTYINWTWENPPDPDFDGTSILIDGNFKTNLSKTSNDYSATDLAPATSHNITVIAFDTSDNLAPQPWPENMGITLPPPPKINVIQEPASLNITVRDSILFDISVDQEANVSWTVNGNTSAPALIQAGGSSNFTFTPTTKGDYSVTVEASNTNGTSSKSWNVTAHPILFFKGNRIWDGSKPDEFSLTYTWNPMSFSGFYYDINNDVGNENIAITLDSYSSRTISSGKLVYTTSPQEVNFGYSGFGSYDVIGFMAEKYFAGYTANSSPPNPTTAIKASSVLAQGQLHKVLIDDDTQRTISLGGTLTLQEGYVLKAKDIDTNARTMLISLLKDGSEVDSTPLSAGQTYVYEKKVGAVSDLPIIMVRFDSVFSGTEVQAAFLKGVFQISENYSAVNSGNSFGKMKVTGISDSEIDMSNDGSISLDNGNTEELMGNVQLKVGDTTDNSLRFYFAVNVTPEMVANQLIIDAPAQATAGDTIPINVTAGGDVIGGASLAIDSSDIGQTDNNGTLNYTLPRTMKGIHNITATKLGYQGANKSIEVLEYIERRLSIDAPATADQFKTITIKVTYNGTAVSNATVKFDNTTIGITDNNGTLNYTLETSGTHTIEASGSGYITVVKEIDIRAPFSQYEALDINITPNVVFTDENAVIKSNITNVGTKSDTLPVQLTINGTAVDNRSVALAPGEIKEINFTRKEAKAGNYTVEILGQKGLLEVKERPFTWNLILIIVIVTGLGLIAVYLLTAKNKISFELIRRKLKFGEFYGR